MPPGPYRATTCRGRELNYGSHTSFFDHTRTWRASPDEWSARCRGNLRDSTNMKDNTHQAHTPIHTNKANKEWWLRRPNDIRGPCGSKVSRHLTYRWGKTPKKPHPENLSRPGIEPGPAAWQRDCYHLLHSGGQVINVNHLIIKWALELRIWETEVRNDLVKKLIIAKVFFYGDNILADPSCELLLYRLTHGHLGCKSRGG